MNKILIFTFTLMILLAISTAIIVKLEPQMHKTIMLEQIIFKKGK